MRFSSFMCTTQRCIYAYFWYETICCLYRKDYFILYSARGGFRLHVLGLENISVVLNAIKFPSPEYFLRYIHISLWYRPTQFTLTQSRLNILCYYICLQRLPERGGLGVSYNPGLHGYGYNRLLGLLGMLRLRGGGLIVDIAYKHTHITNQSVKYTMLMYLLLITHEAV